MIFKRFRCARAFAAYFARSQQNTVKTDTKSTSELSHDKTKTTKNRCDDESDNACRAARAPTLLRTRSGTSWDRPGVALGRLPAALGAPGASQDRSWAGFGASRARPERVPTCPQNGFGRPKPAKTDFSSIFRRFGSAFGRFSNDFSPIVEASCTARPVTVRPFLFPFLVSWDAVKSFLLMPVSSFVRAILALLC